MLMLLRENLWDPKSWYHDYFKVKTFKLQKMQKEIPSEHYPLDLESPTMQLPLNPPKGVSYEFSCLEDRPVILVSIKKHKIVPTFPLKP